MLCSENNSKDFRDYSNFPRRFPIVTLIREISKNIPIWNFLLKCFNLEAFQPGGKYFKLEIKN